MRKKRLVLNTIISFGYQILAVICGFILPRLILQQYGSETNGLVNSINQFISVIAFLELGVGAVVQSSLYKPLAENNSVKVSEIIVSADKFFNKLAYMLCGYVIFLVIVYPYMANQNFGWFYTATLILAMSISSFAQYFFGIVDRLLLNADQRGYIQYTSHIITLILNTLSSVLLINNGASIQVVKLVSSILFLARPLVVRLYVDKRYKIDRKIKYKGEPIKQKWNGVAQHVAAVVLDGTDTIVLTILSTLANVSIYAVYNLVIQGVKQLFLSMFSGFQALIGELWAKQELNGLKKLFSYVEWLMHTGVTFVFTCVGLLIVQFVQVYTLGVNDVNYIQPLFAVLITAANAGHCLRLPYNIMILAAGQYKETQSNYIVATVLNVVISVVTVLRWGLIGVAIGTLVAMVFQTVWMAIYNSKNLLKWPFRNFVKQVVVDVITVLACFSATSFLSFTNVSYFGWIILAVETAVIVGTVVILINIIFYRERMVGLLRNMKV